MKNSTKRVASIFGSMAFLIGSLIVFAYLIEPAYKDIEDSRAALSSKTDLAAVYQNSLDIVASLKSKYQDMLSSQQSISSILPKEQNLPEEVNQMSALAVLNNLSVDALSVERLGIKSSSQPAIAKGIGTLRINLKLTGDYPSFRAFIQALETNLNLFDMVSVKLEPSTKPGVGLNKMTFTMVVDSYYQSE